MARSGQTMTLRGGRAKPGRDARRGRRMLVWGVPMVWFVLGLLCRLVIFLPADHLEGDEQIYRTLVGQLESGRGYTLRGTELLEREAAGGTGRTYPADQYGRALFFHPPGGIVLFRILHEPFGERAWPLAQVLSYAIFFWSLLAMARALPAPLDELRLHFISALAAFTPLMTHVVSRYWIDGPMLAFTTFAAARFLRAVLRRDLRRVIIAALVMGCATWIKASALVVVPAIVLLAWAAAEPGARRAALRFGLVFAAVAALVQLPWEIWQWAVLGSPLVAAGRPSAEMIANNRYVHFLTVERAPWIYLTLLPRVLWTIVPTLACLAVPGLDARGRRIALALLGWIALALLAVIGLGAAGYSKVVRYAILVTPATILLFALVAGQAWQARSDARLTRHQRWLARALALFALAGLGLEIAQGVYTPLFDRGSDLIVPILLRGPGWW